MTPGAKFKQAVSGGDKPLMILGAPTPYVAIQMEAQGFKVAYLSGAGMSYFTHGIPDVGILGLEEVAHEVRKFHRVTDLPLFVDVDTGWQDAQQTVETLITCGAAAMHMEDQTEDKRCGHLDGKTLVSTDEMCTRIKKAIAGKTSGPKKDADFMVMARTDALAVEGFDAMLDRMEAYVEAGADAIFAEAMTDIAHYKQIRQRLGADIPLLANLTEYGKTDIYTRDELAQVDVDMMLMPVSLNRAMHGLVPMWLEEIQKTGTTKGMVERGEIRPRSEYSKLVNYDPEHDNRETVQARLNARASN